MWRSQSMLDRAKRTATLHFDHTYVAVMRDCGVDSAEERLQTVQKADDDDDVDERETLV